jgi:hypothetical protein
MRDDVGFAIHKDALRASVVLGYNDMQSAAFSQQAWLTSASSFGNLVSREYWAGAALADESILIRGGRIALPFGLRNIEHTFFVRTATRTDVNQDQQDGLAVAYNSERIRAEAMAVLGNYQVRPDEFRDRGYAAYGEYRFGMHWAAGVSSMVLHAQRDLSSNVETWRQAHGAFARAAPIEPVVVLAEFDALVSSPAGSSTQAGYTGLLQVDVEPLQGVHVLGTGEVLNYGIPGQSTNVGTWLGVMWFPVSHFELRGDVIRYTAAGTPTLMTYLLQGQLYL